VTHLKPCVVSAADVAAAGLQSEVVWSFGHPGHKRMLRDVSVNVGKFAAVGIDVSGLEQSHAE
jgi:hypothetical protein